jgi:hypothetical protein
MRRDHTSTRTTGRAAAPVQQRDRYGLIATPRRPLFSVYKLFGLRLLSFDQLTTVPVRDGGFWFPI